MSTYYHVKCIQLHMSFKLIYYYSLKAAETVSISEREFVKDIKYA